MQRMQRLRPWSSGAYRPWSEILVFDDKKHDLRQILEELASNQPQRTLVGIVSKTRASGNVCSFVRKLEAAHRKERMGDILPKIRERTMVAIGG
jgi:hypothetical protein